MSCTTRILMYGNSIVQYKAPTATSEFQSHPRTWLAISTLRQWYNLQADNIKSMPRDFHAFDSRYITFVTTIWGEAGWNEGKPKSTDTKQTLANGRTYEFLYGDMRVPLSHKTFLITWLLSTCERHAILHITQATSPEPFITYPQERTRKALCFCVLN